MRIIHTADWHIGQTLAGWSREHEHRAVLADLARIARDVAADALIIAGDVFDHQNPSGEAQRIYYETLIALKRARPAMTIIVTAGNHDAAGRLEAAAGLLRPIDIHVIGNVRRTGQDIDAAHHLVALRGPGGDVEANMLAVSYPTAACLPPFGSIAVAAGHSSVAEATRALYAELLEKSGAAASPLPLVVTGHLHVQGALQSSGSERRILVGGAHAVPVDVFPERAAYVALGHLHKPQSVGRESVRYSGSLLPLSATEHAYRHSVTLVTIDAGRITTEQIALARPVPFLRLPDSGELRLGELEAQLAALRLDADLPVERWPFVHVHLARDGLPPGYRAEADRIAAAFPVRLVAVSVAPAAAEAADETPTVVPPRLADLEPEHMFELAFAQCFDGRAPDAEHKAAFHRAAAAAAAEG